MFCLSNFQKPEMGILIVSDSILRGVTARHSIYRRYRKNGKTYQRIKGTPAALLQLALVQVIFGGWSPASEGLTDKQKRKIKSAVELAKEEITQVLLVTGINSIRRNLFSKKLLTPSQHTKRINETAGSIYRVVCDLKKMFPCAKLTYLGSSRLLTKSDMPPSMGVDEKLKALNRDITALMTRVHKEFAWWKTFVYNSNKRTNQHKQCPEMRDIFEKLNDTHIWDLWGHLSPSGNEIIAQAIQKIAEENSEQ